jgi:DNA invertase Pin-like site-specific DNA recombinase
MPRIISYTRFSSRKQAKGVSYARQVEAARKWCEAHGYVLDENDKYEDLGVSAFSGKNAAAGALSTLQKKLHSGEIERGTILIVEALDRITRQALPQAITLLMNLATSGLTVVTLSDGKEWDEEKMKDLGAFMMSVVTLYRGHQESEYKSKRVRDAFKKHRQAGSQQVFGAAPGWLSRDDKHSPWVVDEEKAAVVRKVFELSAAGFGSKLIAKKANAENWVVPTRLAEQEKGWHAQLPGQLLRNNAVLGEHQHRIRTHEAHEQNWEGLPVGEPIADYYPRIVSDNLWNRARASIRARAAAKRRDMHYYNVFSGLMYCGLCGAPIHRKSERNGHSHAQLQCSDKLAGKTECKTMAANRADPDILKAIYEYTHGMLGNSGGAATAADIEAIEVSIAEKMEQCDRIADAIAVTGGRVQSLINKSVQLTNEAAELKQQRTRLREELAQQSTGSVFDDTFLSEAMAFLYVPDDETAKEKRAELHLKIVSVVHHIWLYAYDLAYIVYKNGSRQPVMLQHKQLPSRVNPNAKYHKPPKPRPVPDKPYWRAAIAWELDPPRPRRSATFQKKRKPFLLEYEEETEEEGYPDA